MVQRFVESFRSTEGYDLTVICKSGSLPYPSRVQWYRAEGTGDSTILIPIPVSWGVSGIVYDSFMLELLAVIWEFVYLLEL